MQKKMYTVVNALEFEDLIGAFILENSNALVLNREAWSNHRGEMPSDLIKTPVNIHYGLDSDSRFLHVVKTIEDDLIKRINGTYYYNLSPYLRSIFEKEGIFSENDPGEYAFHEHFYGFSDVIKFYNNEHVIAIVASGSGEALLNLSDKEKKQLESHYILFEDAKSI